MKIIILSLFILFVMANVQSCHDAFDLETNIAKDSLNKKLNADDSVSFLEVIPIDFGSIKVGTVTELPITIKNISENKIIEIYSVKSTDVTGLFTVKTVAGLPLFLNPGEVTLGSKEIRVKFIAGSFSLGNYYDTLIINNVKNYRYPIKAKISY